MGKHWGDGPEKRTGGACSIVARILGVGTVSALTVLAFGFHGPQVASLDSGLTAGGGGRAAPGTATAATEPGAGTVKSAPGMFVADVHAIVSFSRSDVRTTSKDGKHELNVASLGLRRPPEGSLMAPLETLNASSPFGLRVSPLSGTAGEFHWGQDFAAACGTRVYAADAGVVRAVGWHPWGGGNRVEIDHGNGLITTYNHLEAIAVKKGESVQVGEVIARVGTTGSSTGCHLHFETILNGAHTDPLKWTLLPTKQLDELENIEMISYLPGTNAPEGAPTWAIPVSEDNSHAVTGGETEDVVPAPPEPPVTAPPVPATPEPTATATPTPTPIVTTTPTVTATPTPTVTPTPIVTPTPTVTVTPTPTPTPTPTVTVTVTVTPAPTVTPTPTATVTSTPTGSQSSAQAPAATPAASSAPAATTAATPTPAPSREPAPEPTATSTKPTATVRPTP